MAEAEGVLIEGTRIAASATSALWRRRRPRDERPELALDAIRERLALFVGALSPVAPPLLPADRPAPPTWLARVLGRAPRHLVLRTAHAATDGTHIWLPRTLDATAGEAAAMATYRLLAVEQAARAARETARHAPRGASHALERDLYLLAEAVAIDQAIAATYPGLGADLRAARAAALAERPVESALRPVERAVERLVRLVLAADPLAPVPDVACPPTPAASLRWARAVAGRIRSAGGRYRGVAIVPLWGALADPAGHGAGGLDGAEPVPAEPEERRPRTARLRRRPAVRERSADEDDPQTGTWMVRFDDPMESVEDPMGLVRPADRDQSADAEGLADALADLAEAPMVRTPETPAEVLESDAPPAARTPAAGDTAPAGAGIVYPEWDYRVNAYRPRGAVVWPSVPPAGDPAWVDRVMTRHAALVRQVRRRFDTLRPRRVRLHRQRDGDDIDLAAYVTAFADRRAGQPSAEQLYTAERPGRRDLAIALLIDASASTDAWVAGDQRIIDVEKEALLLLVEALDALGDRHAIFGFSGQGPEAVRLLAIKRFDEATGPEVRRRIASLEPDRYTRAGAALRHATAMLAAQGVRHRLLLVLSDGKPNDVDRYEGRYGVEDTRQAVAEARLLGIVPFCLTVDREAPAYLPAIFGRDGYALLRRPERLPAVLMDVVRRLLAVAT